MRVREGGTAESCEPAATTSMTLSLTPICEGRRRGSDAEWRSAAAAAAAKWRRTAKAKSSQVKPGSSSSGASTRPVHKAGGRRCVMWPLPARRAPAGSSRLQLAPARDLSWLQYHWALEQGRSRSTGALARVRAVRARPHDQHFQSTFSRQYRGLFLIEGCDHCRFAYKIRIRITDNNCHKYKWQMLP